MRKFGNWSVGSAAALLLFVFISASSRADTMEVRDFPVRVNGKTVGFSQVIITEKADGTYIVTNRANVEVRLLFLKFGFSYNGTETWKGYRLVGLNGIGKQDGTTYNVSGSYEPRNRSFRLRVNGREQFVSGDVWTTLFWRLPQKNVPKTQGVTVLKTSYGTVTKRKLEYINTVQIPIAGRNQKCYHFRLTGGPKTIDIWYDVQHRIVRQQFVEKGRSVIIEMSNIRRTKKKQ